MSNFHQKPFKCIWQIKARDIVLPWKNHDTEFLEKEKIAKLKRDHATKVKCINDIIQGMEEKRCWNKEETEREIQILLKTV